ncbi:MAG: NADH-quinone oxidoreductase subunit J, partial [Snodgrassella sp.]|nr:NADH-quinone oxidoreductase subunit J [Snodgrassella sp.]
ELAAIVLVLGMVAAIALVHRQTPNPRRTNPAEQVKVQAKDRFRMVKMQPEVATPITETREEATAGEEKA